MPRPTPQDLRTADDAIVAVLAAVGDCLPDALRDSLIRVSDWCWMRRIDGLHNLPIQARRRA
jgi:hypothetical protein